MVESLVQKLAQAKSLFRALVALSFLAPLWLMPRRASSRFLPPTLNLPLPPDHAGWGQQLFRLSSTSAKDWQVSTWQGMNLERIVALKPDR